MNISKINEVESDRLIKRLRRPNRPGKKIKKATSSFAKQVSDPDAVGEILASSRSSRQSALLSAGRRFFTRRESYHVRKQNQEDFTDMDELFSLNACTLILARDVPEAWLRRHLSSLDRRFDAQNCPASAYEFYSRVANLIRNFADHSAEIKSLIINFIEGYTPDNEDWNDSLMVLRDYNIIQVKKDM